ncbi:MAG: MucBP domain-containing protein, partial [Lachnospiraceae bacterium]|nr:MucBP domain-containing protein [Lachnospiraceae bacterium]
VVVDPTDAKTTFGTKSVTVGGRYANTFNFTLAATSADAPMPETNVAALTYAARATGAQTIPFGEITYDKTGTYTYTITEAYPGQWWTATGNGGTVTVKVTDNGDGTLSAEVSGITITNSYRELYTVTVRYRYVGGGTAAPTVRMTFEEGDHYYIQSPTISGYTVSRTSVQGTMPARDLEYTVYYSRPEDDEIVILDYGTPLGLGNLALNTGDCVE